MLSCVACCVGVRLSRHVANKQSLTTSRSRWRTSAAGPWEVSLEANVKRRVFVAASRRRMKVDHRPRLSPFLARTENGSQLREHLGTIFFGSFFFLGKMGNIQSTTHYIFKENLEKVSACKEQDKNKHCMFVTVSPCSGSALKTHVVPWRILLHGLWSDKAASK